MIVQIMSDLHLGRGADGVPALSPGASLVVVAGDTREGLVESIDALRAAFPDRAEIAMVAGNHEYYGRTLGEELEAGRLRARAVGVHLLENDVATFGPLRLLGATLWTDYLLLGRDLQEAAMRAAYEGMRDHKRIRWQTEPWRRFRPHEARALHLRSRQFLERELAKPHEGPTMLLAHHGATREAIEPDKRSSLLSAAYASELSFLERFAPDYVVTGHSHRPMDFRRGRTRFISNPRGYPGEGVRFDPSFTIEVTDAH